MWSHSPNLRLTLFLVLKHFNMSLFSLALQLHYPGNSRMFVGLDKMLDVITLDIFDYFMEETFNRFTRVKKNLQKSMRYNPASSRPGPSKEPWNANKHMHVCARNR